jgi:twinkle protein
MGGDCKDANDYLTKGKQEEFVKCWWNSKGFKPKGIINSNDEVFKVLSQEGTGAIATFPFPTLNEMTGGIRSGDVLLFTALEKVGKTSIMRAIEHHLIKTTDYNIAIIHLEEKEKKSIEGLISYELGVPVQREDSNVSLEEKVEAYKKLVKVDNRVHYYTHFGSDDPDVILDVLRYLVNVCHCKFVFLDHITMIVTGSEEDDQTRKLDYLSTRFAMLVKELDFTLFLVSHVNDHGQTRGSRNISKTASLIVHMDRDIEAENYDKRNTTKLIVRGNRDFHESGPAGYLWFDAKDYTVKEKTEQTTVDAQVPF